MAKKVRFPLEMEDGVEVRTMEELRDAFSLERVIQYIWDDKLVIWLRDRYEHDLADAIEALDLSDPASLPKKVSEIFEVPYEEEVELTEEEKQQAAERAERLAKLQSYTTDEQYAAVIDSVAFDQDELYDLLDEDVREIYLCGERFVIPLGARGVTYIGVNKPVVVIDSKTEVDLAAKKIKLQDVRFDRKYQNIVDEANSNKVVSIGETTQKSYLRFLLSAADKKASDAMYDMAKDAIAKINYYDRKNILTLEQKVLDSGLIGMGIQFVSVDTASLVYAKMVFDNGLIGIGERYISEL